VLLSFLQFPPQDLAEQEARAVRVGVPVNGHTTRGCTWSFCRRKDRDGSCGVGRGWGVQTSLKLNGKTMSLLRVVISVILDVNVGHFKVAVCVL
jgi:hypothetical protein